MSFLPPSSCFHCFIICIPATEAMTSDIHDHLPLDNVAIYTEICANYINTQEIYLEENFPYQALAIRFLQIKF